MIDNPTLFDLTAFMQLRRNKRARRRVTVHLSPQERRVMQMKADGMTTEGIAHRLCVSVHVVRLYIEKVHRKLDAQSTACAVAKCVALKLIAAHVGEYIEVA